MAIHTPVPMSVAETLLPVLQWAVSAGFSDATRPDGGPVLLRLPRLRHACNGGTHLLRSQVQCEAPTTTAWLHPSAQTTSLPRRRLKIPPRPQIPPTTSLHPTRATSNAYASSDDRALLRKPWGVRSIHLEVWEVSDRSVNWHGHQTQCTAHVYQVTARSDHGNTPKQGGQQGGQMHHWSRLPCLVLAGW